MVVLGAVWAGLLARIILDLRAHQSCLTELGFAGVLLPVTLLIARVGKRQRRSQEARGRRGEGGAGEA
jgi:hypothetical protein